MKRPAEVLRGAGSAAPKWWSAVAGASERDLLLGTILLASAISGAMAFALSQYYSIDVFSSLSFLPQDCWQDFGAAVGKHCFSDYAMPVKLGLRPNAWEPYPVFITGTNGGPSKPYLNNYPAAGMLPQLTFGLIGALLHAPAVGLWAYLLALTLGLLSPALWAAKGARGLEKIVVFVACGPLAIPAWAAVDRGNAVGFVVPLALVYLIALCRRRWGLVAVMVVLAVLVKPQFVVLGVVLVAARQWRLSGIALLGCVVSNIGAYLLWPRNFPHTISQSLHNTVGSIPFDWLTGLPNVSFVKALFSIPDAMVLQGGKVPDGYLVEQRMLSSYLIALVMAGAVVALGRRIPPAMAGVVLLATASLFPAMTNRYYLVFALPIAALVVRDPEGVPGSGVFDRLAAVGDRRRVVGVCVSLAAALSIAQVLLPSPPISAPILGQGGVSGIVATSRVVVTTAAFTPFYWLIACGAILISYARRPAPSFRTRERARRHQDQAAEGQRRTRLSLNAHRDAHVN